MAKNSFDTPWFIKRSKTEIFLYWINLIILALFCASIILPFVHILALSFNDGNDAMRGGVYLWPRVFSLENYMEVFSDDAIMRGYFITISRTSIGTVSAVFLTAMAAYVLRTRGLPGKNIFSIFLLITMLFGGGTIPTYMVYKELNLLNSFWVYILPGLYSAWNIVIMRTFFQTTISYSLEESAKLDGCSDFSIFMKIYMPLAKPSIAVIALMTAVGQWNSWFDAAYYVMNKDLHPVQMIIREMLTESARMLELMQSSADAINVAQRAVTGESLKMATIIVAVAPIICIYPFFQKYFAKGVMIGAVKE